MPTRSSNNHGGVAGRIARAGRRQAAIGPIAIDIRDGIARLLQIDQSSGHVVAAARVAHDDAHPERTAERISNAVAGEGFRGDSCVIGLPHTMVRTEALCVTEGHDDDVRAEVERLVLERPWCARPEVGFIRLAPVDAMRTEVIAVIADRGALESLLHPLLDWGLIPDAAEPSFVAVSRACSRVFRRNSDQSRVRIAVDTSRHGATAMLLTGDRIAYARSTDSCETFVELISACLRDGAAFVPDRQAPTEIRLTGAFAEDKRLHAALESTCGLPVRLDDSQSTICMAWRSIAARIAREDRPWEWSAALGLAFRSASRRQMREIADRLAKKEAA
ncbi:MAG: hypothetical protein JNM94_16050 [Phycisphaerae bacterium]|nr:hypothetical protein [Phycisphaerae bacterium]